MGRIEYLDNQDEASDDLETAEAVLDVVENADNEENAKACLELETLVKDWIKLVVEGKRERQPGQVRLCVVVVAGGRF